MARIPRQHFSKTFQQTSAADLANNRLIFARFPRQGGRIAGPYSRPYSSRTSVFGTEIEAASGCTVHQSFAAFWHEFQGPYSSIYCCFGTYFKVAVQLHLLQIFGHKKRGNPYNIYCYSCFVVCTFSEAVVKHGKRDKL